jgi:hypothetical protein
MSRSTGLFDVIENIKAEEATPARLFGDAGIRAGHGKRTKDQRYGEHLAEAATFIADVLEGVIPMYRLHEAMGTSDFPLLFGDVLDRMLLGRYQEIDPVYRQYTKQSKVRDFRPSRRFAVDGAEGRLERVGERGEYKEEALVESSDDLQVFKRGRRLGASWEQMINDDLDAFAENPDRLARAARRTEQFEADSLWLDANGPHASLYTAPNGNILTGNPAFSIDALGAAIEHFATLVDEDNEPIAMGPLVLVYGPALRVEVMKVLNATELRFGAGTAAENRVHTVNFIKGMLTPVETPYLPIISASTPGAWALFASPTESRPALEVAHLRGHEAPALYMKSPNSIRVGGGGLVDPMDGDFDTDSMQHKVRHVFGGTRLVSTGGWRATVASNGSGEAS